ncbi:hypothetical protein K227x_14530 [Rubripirellula lacrimiformis]|uniref:Uncharacterized protein n=2 Tax=Rubripirellula lacrimiformis TaxID=1930273 RepID=A0A517N7F1_9BACT|nr:hypothetical protein K227x_14530 [Rubripirellula lacrimiformis]
MIDQPERWSTNGCGRQWDVGRKCRSFGCWSLADWHAIPPNWICDVVNEDRNLEYRVDTGLGFLKQSSDY